MPGSTMSVSRGSGGLATRLSRPAWNVRTSPVPSGASTNVLALASEVRKRRIANAKPAANDRLDQAKLQVERLMGLPTFEARPPTATMTAVSYRVRTKEGRIPHGARVVNAFPRPRFTAP